MDLTLNEKVLREFRDKDSRKPHFRELYEKHDFLTAYAKHTDLRVADNPKGAIGREDEWESHGALQLSFLIGEGLRRDFHLLDVGCGVGRFARKAVPFLNDYCYTGVDISAAALEHAFALSESEGWDKKHPKFILNSDLELGPAARFDMLWAHSVFTHLPPQQIMTMISKAAALLTEGGKFLFTYRAAKTPQPLRTGLKQFATPAVFFATIAPRYGFKSEPLQYVFPAHQNTMRLTRLADDVDDEDEDE